MIINKEEVKVRKEERREQIVDIAIELMHRNGIKGFTLREIAKRLGTTEPAIYRYFQSKDKILEKILERFEKFHLKNFEFIENIKDPYEKIMFLMENVIKFFKKNPEVATLFLSEQMFLSDSKLKEKLSKISTRLQHKFIEILQKAFVSAGESEIDYESLGFIISGALRAVVMNWILSECKYDIEWKSKKVEKTVVELLKSYFGGKDV